MIVTVGSLTAESALLVDKMRTTQTLAAENYPL